MRMNVVVQCRDFYSLEENDCKAIIELLEQDPRSAYEKKESFEYGVFYGDYNIKFHVEGDVVYIDEVEKNSFTPSK